MCRTARIEFFLKVFLILITVGCAKETSDKERQREEQRREIDRLEKASGYFSGYVIVDRGVVPAAVDVSTQLNPSNNQQNPKLRVVLKLGFFGGVDLSATQVSYDAENGQLVASFGASAPSSSTTSGSSGSEGGDSDKSGSFSLMANSGGGLEFRGYIDGDHINEAVLDGVHQGAHEMVLSKNYQDPFDNNSEEFRYSISGNNTNDLGVLTVKQSTVMRQPFANSDLAKLPPLDAEITFFALGVFPQKASNIQYDPINTLVEIDFSNSAKIVFSDVLLPHEISLNEDHLDSIKTMKGYVEVSGKSYADIMANIPSKLLLSGIGIKTPPQNYSGTYQSGNRALTLDSFAFLEYDYSSQTQLNSSSLPFSKIPSFKFKLTTCLDGKIFTNKIYNIESIDYFNQRISFADIGSNTKEVLILDYKNDWNSLTGKFLVSTLGNNSTAYISLNKSSNQEQDCEIFR
ncbi:MAG: hypothetical protein R3B45_03850 [Bdellovibrionota bacterium]